MDKIEELLTRGVAEIIPGKEDLEKLLRSDKKLRVYQGFDPTSAQFHIGHMVGLRKLKQWQNLGHEVIFLIGDFTGMIGDPTGKDKTRIPLTKEQVLKNAQSYKTQASKILRFDGENPVKIKYNSEWLEKIPAAELIKLTSYLTFQQIIERDMFQKRLKNNMDISISEFLYPFMQGYDSVAMDVDVEVGGNDQLFNMLTGRDLMHKIKKKDKFVMTTPLLIDSRGIKIGKTEGNAIAIDDKPENLYAKIMSLPDDIIIKGFEYLTDITMDEIGSIKRALENGDNPVAYKKKLAFEIVKQLNTTEDANKAQESFESVVQKKENPEDIREVDLSMFGIKKISIEELLANPLYKLEMAKSKSDAERLIEQGGVKINNETIRDPNRTIELIDKMIISVGKHKFVKIISK